MKKLSEGEFIITSPFGPRIGIVQCPTEVVDIMIQITDELVEKENYKSWGKNLVGQIKEEPYISNELLKERGVYDFFNNCLYDYVKNVGEDIQRLPSGEQIELKTGIKNMWSVHMKPGGEYNPLHYHTRCNVSSVLYLKIPTDSPKRNILYKKDRDGYIELVDHAKNGAYPHSLDRGTMLIEPTVGTMYIWPSQVLHTVYPFLGEEERRSIAWNGTFSVEDKITGVKL